LLNRRVITLLITGTLAVAFTFNDHDVRPHCNHVHYLCLRGSISKAFDNLDDATGMFGEIILFCLGRCIDSVQTEMSMSVTGIFYYCNLYRASGQCPPGISGWLTGPSGSPNPHDGEHQFIIIGDRERFDPKYLGMLEN